MDMHMVTRGAYETYEVLAVFADMSDAEAYVEWWNMTNASKAIDAEAEISYIVPVYRTNEWQPVWPDAIQAFMDRQRAA